MDHGVPCSVFASYKGDEGKEICGDTTRTKPTRTPMLAIAGFLATPPQFSRGERTTSIGALRGFDQQLVDQNRI